MRIVTAEGFEIDHWQLVGDDEAALPAGAILPLARWQRESPAGGVSPFGLLLRADDPRDAIVAAAPRCPLIAIEFARFTDGRGYSLAQIGRASCRERV